VVCCGCANETLFVDEHTNILNAPPKSAFFSLTHIIRISQKSNATPAYRIAVVGPVLALFLDAVDKILETLWGVSAV